MEKNRVKIMTEVGLAVSLAAVLNFMPLWKMPQGGSVSLEMLPILLVTLRWDWKTGMLAGAVYGFLQLIINPYIIHPAQLLLDYPVPYLMLGLAGFIILQKKDSLKANSLRLFLSISLGGAGRFLSHLFSGAIFFGQYAPEGQNPWIYSAIYNLSYLIPSLILCYILLLTLLNRFVFDKESR